MKVWERIIKTLRVESVTGKEQFDFMPGQGTMDTISALRQVMKQHRKMQEIHKLIWKRLTIQYTDRKFVKV